MEQPLSINQAISEVNNIKQQVMAMGANDSENSQFDEIISSLSNKKISPTEAVKQANTILNSKQDYH